MYDLKVYAMEKTNKKVLLVLAHPHYEESVANRALVEAVKGLPGVTVLDLYAPEQNGEAQQRMLSEADALVFQFPFYWASAPSALKGWIDEIFMAVSMTGKLAGKRLLVAATAGSEYDAYRSGGRNRFTMDELLRPYQFMAHHVAMEWETPFVVYGMGTPEAEENVREGGDALPEAIEDFFTYFGSMPRKKNLPGR